MKKRIVALLSGALALAFVAIAQEPEQPPKPPSAQERFQHVTQRLNKELQLTAAQKEKIAASYQAFFADVEKLRTKEGKPLPPPPPPPLNKVEMDKLAATRDEKIKAVLDAEQYKKYVAIEKTLRPGGHGMQKGKPRGKGDEEMPPPLPRSSKGDN